MADDEVETFIDTILEAYDYNPDRLSDMVGDVLGRFPELDAAEVTEGVAARIEMGMADEDVDEESDKAESTEGLWAEMEMEVKRRPIADQDLVDALLMGDIDSSVDYLLNMYPEYTHEEIKLALMPLIEPSRKGSSKKRKRDTITDHEVTEALEFYGFRFGADMKDKVTQYLSKKYPSLRREDIVNQLRDYDFDIVVTSPKKKRTRTDDTAASSSTTPPARESAYHPSDFSPSSMGAASLGAMEELKEKRSKHFPSYVSPPRTPPPPRGPLTPKRFREDFTPPPKTPERPRRDATDRRLSFSSPLPSERRRDSSSSRPKGPSIRKRAI